MARESIRAIFADRNATHAEVDRLLFGPSGPAGPAFQRECIETVIDWQANRHAWRGAPAAEAKEMALLTMAWVAKWAQLDPESACQALATVAAKGLPQSLALQAFEDLARIVGPEHPVLDEIARDCEDEETAALFAEGLDVLRGDEPEWGGEGEGDGDEGDDGDFESRDDDDDATEADDD